jgi:Mn-dependent DtxR family transcriptional regulator
MLLFNLIVNSNVLYLTHFYANQGRSTKSVAFSGLSTHDGLVQTKRKPARSPRPESSESTEDHLERIAELIDLKGYARVSDVALKLGLTRSSVSNMVRRLAKRGFLDYEKYRGFTLTESGRAVANHVRARHQILTEMLQLLGLSPETIEVEVEAIEHHLMPETLQAFSKLVRYWRARPEQLKSFLHSGKPPREGGVH